MSENRDAAGKFRAGQSGNPAGRPRKGARVDSASAERTEAMIGAARHDGWVNTSTGYGTARDKRTGTYFAVCPVTIQEAEHLWQGDDLAARVIETLPSEMLREGFELTITEDAKPKPASRKRPAVIAEADDPLAERVPGTAMDRARARRDAALEAAPAKPSHEIVDEVAQAWEDLELTDALWHALAYERAYGGGAILIGANDGQSSMKSPLDEDRIIELSYLLALEPREIIPVKWYSDPLAKNFGKPEIYLLNPQGTGLPSTSARGQVSLLEVHESRLAVFPGIRTSRIMRTSVTYGWGDNVMTRFVPVLRDFNVGLASAGVLLTDFAQGVFKMKNLVETMTGENVDQFEARVRSIEMSRSTLRSILIDADQESFERTTTPITGMPELLDRFSTRLAAAADMPLTLLMGQSPAGLNATGASDIRFFYDRVAAMQRRKLAPVIRQITRIIMRALKAEPSKWTINFAPLWQPTEAEQATARKTQADTDAVYIDRQVLSADEVAIARFGGPKYSFETHVDLEAREALEMPGEMPDDIRDPNAPLGADDEAPGAAVAGGAKTMAAAGAPPAQAAMNGAQVTSMIEVCRSFFAKEIPREAAIAILTVGFPISKEQASAMLPESFEAAKPEPPPMPFGGGGKPGGAPPFGGKPAAENTPGDEGGKAALAAKGKAEADAPAGLDGQIDPDEDDDEDEDERADYNPDQPRAENGEFGEGGGTSSGGGDGDKGGGLAKLTSHERQMLAMRAKGLSDKKVLAALKMTQTEAMRVGNSIREKLGLGQGGSLKDAGRAHGLHKEK